MVITDVILYAVLGLVAGILSAVCGVGGGILVVPALVLLRGVDVRVAVATSLAYIVPTALWGALRKPAGLVDWKVAAVLGAGGVLGATIGVWAANEISAAWTKRILAVVLVAAAIQLFRDA